MAAILQALADLASELPWLVPLGMIGVWRWIMWLAKRLPALFYRPIQNNYRCSATVVTAVYAENPDLFAKALASWKASGVDRIVAVIQGRDPSCVQVANRFPGVEAVVIPEPGKRLALATGIDLCTTDIVVLADSDAIWAPDVLAQLMMPFADSTIGGVGTRQNIMPSGLTPTLWEKLADVFLNLRYADEIPATTRWGRAVSCLSGRTSAYRTELLKRFRGEFLNETFNGQVCDSGDDKRYTSLVLKHGYATWAQLSAQVYSTFQPTLSGFIRQRVRWSRNTYRSDLRALHEGWIWRHPYLSLLLVDKAIAPFAQVFGLGIFVFATVTSIWEVILIQFVWWHLSRGVKMIPHLRKCPRDLILLTPFIAAGMLSSFIKIYGLLTLNRHQWLTREETPEPSPAGVASEAAS